MQTQKVITYSFDELPIETQEAIANSWRDNDYFIWGDDWAKSLEAFADYFGLHIKDWRVDLYSQSYVNFYFKCDEDATKGVRLFKMLLNRHFFAENMQNEDCPLTGFCGDENLLEPIRDFMKKPCRYTSFYELIEDCLDNWIKGYKADIEHWEGFDCIKEEILSNDYQFTDDGDLF